MVSKKPPPKNNRPCLLHKINIGHVDITIDQYLHRSVPRTCVAQLFFMRRQTTFVVCFYFRHSESGIDFPQTLRPPHTLRMSWLALVHQHLPHIQKNSMYIVSDYKKSPVVYYTIHFIRKRLNLVIYLKR